MKRKERLKQKGKTVLPPEKAKTATVLSVHYCSHVVCEGWRLPTT
jgi:hypothetical protein